MTQKTHFGYQEIDINEKQTRVQGVFSSVANRYDIMNDFMSGGLHRLWKNRMIASINPLPRELHIDMAGGTGDIAFRLQDALSARSINSTEIAICDLNLEMLESGRDRAINSLRHQKSPKLSWHNINAESLPFADNSADGYTIAFGIRNVTDIPKALKEAYRCLKPGSLMSCLEFSPKQAEWLQPIYDKYSFNIMPLLGKLVANDEASYRYLAESIRMFPDADKFSDMLKNSGFDRVDVTSMTGGIVNLHRAWKL